MAYGDVVALQRYFEEIEESKIPKQNKETINKFYREEIVKGVKESSMRWKIYTLIRLAFMFPHKRFSQMTKDDIVNFLHDVKPRSQSNNKDKRRTQYKETTKVMFKICVKNFFKWLNGGKEYTENVEWIYAGGNTSKKMNEKDILTPEEVLEMVKKAGNTRDAALIYTLFETGCRISEWLNIKYSDIQLDGRTATVEVDGKTGERKVYLIKSLSYFRDWLNVHPLKDQDDFPIWVSMESTTFGHQILPCSVRKNFLRIKKLAKIKKPVNPHAFRHARATDCARRGYQESLMRKMFGWSKDSSMPSVYIHMVSRDVKNKLLSDAGLEETYQNQNKAMDLIECPKCGKKHGAGTKFCTCGFVLDEREAQKIDVEKEGKALSMMQNLLQNMRQLERKGVDFKQFSEFMENWVKASEKGS